MKNIKTECPFQGLISKDYFALYCYGSRVFGTSHINSDWDLVAAYEDPALHNVHVNQAVDMSVFSRAMFQEKINKHDDKILTCLFMPPEFVIIQPKEKWHFELDVEKLWTVFSKKAAYHWKRGKHFFVKQPKRDDCFYVAKKELVHSLRTLDFGIQIAKYGKIQNMQTMISEYHRMMSSPSTSWKEYEDEWRPVYDVLFSDFRKETLESTYD